jgi:hypothetical protein
VIERDLLSLWERGEGHRASRRALALLGDDFAAVPIGRRDAALLELRVAWFGDAFTGVTSCPACGEEIELSFGAEEVRRIAPDSSGVRLPTTEDLIAIEHLTDVEEARAALLARCGASEEDVERMAALDPQADVQIDADCPSCGHRWREPFDIVTFLWTEVAVLARRLLADVHDLASAYHWSERDILALSSARRSAYLGMLR